MIDYIQAAKEQMNEDELQSQMEEEANEIQQAQSQADWMDAYCEALEELEA